MLSYWRRHKRRILAVAAAGAAGAAAYYVYKRWSWGPDDADEPSGPGVEGGDTLVDPRGTAATAHRDAEAHLQHHFDSIQDIADNTTIPSLLPALAAALNRAADVDGLLEKLRQNKESPGGGSGGSSGSIQGAAGGGGGLSGADKVAVWEELKLAAFTRAVGSLWLLPLLDLFVRVQLNILGRHLYLESALGSRKLGPPAGGAPDLLPPRLSAASQEAFLSYAEFLSREGAGALLGEVRAAVERAVGGVALQQQLDAAALGRLLSDVLADFTHAAHVAGWDTFLLPPPAEVAELLSAPPPPRSPGSRVPPQVPPLPLVDREAVEGMLTEARRVVRSDRFHSTLVACVRELSREAVGRLCDRLAARPLPLAKLVPTVAAVGQDYLAPGTPSVARLAQLEEVHSLCASVYSCGPPL